MLNNLVIPFQLSKKKHWSSIWLLIHLSNFLLSVPLSAVLWIIQFIQHLLKEMGSFTLGFFHPPLSGIASCVGTMLVVKYSTLGVTLLCSSRVDSDLECMSMFVEEILSIGFPLFPRGCLFLWRRDKAKLCCFTLG